MEGSAIEIAKVIDSLLDDPEAMKLYLATMQDRIHDYRDSLITIIQRLQLKEDELLKRRELLEKILECNSQIQPYTHKIAQLKDNISRILTDINVLRTQAIMAGSSDHA
jgi:seryl-tRNA synthetase